MALYPWQQQSWQHFVSLYQQQRLPHALLLQGLHGLGKSRFAEHMIGYYLCQNTTDATQACGHCHSCQLFAAGSHPDHLLIMPDELGKAIKVDQIRQLKERQSLMAKVSARKTVLITPADAMNISASNSLLKLLEEPQQATLLILIAEHPEQLPITIRSRCQSIKLQSPQIEQGLDWLRSTLPDKSPEELQRLLQLAYGAPLQAVALAEHGVTQYRQLQQDMAAIMRKQADPIELADRWQTMDLLIVMQQLQQMIQGKLRQL